MWLIVGYLRKLEITYPCANMAAVTLTVTLLLLTAGGVSSRADFWRFELLSVYVRDTPDAQFLIDQVEKGPWIDLWILPVPERNSTVSVAPHVAKAFKHAVDKQGMRLVVLSYDLQSLVDAGNERTPEQVVQENMRASGHVIDHYNYHNYSTIVDYVNKLESKYPGQVRVSVLGNFSHEGKYVTFARLCSPYSNTKKPVIFVEAGIHAREWIGPAATLWVMEKMLQDYQASLPAATLMLDNYDWFVVPVTNPDGYDYTHTWNRMWLRNRRYISTRWDCWGVDLNRNFNTMFGTTDVQFKDRCDTEFYPGYGAFSEPESANIRNIIDILRERVVAYVSVHAYGQSLQVPWRYSSDESRPANHEELDRVVSLMTRYISQRHGNEYSYGMTRQRYAVSGSAIDWVQENKPDVYAVSVKLRPAASATEGFLLPASQIIPTGEEFYDGLAVLAKEMSSFEH